jgi:hypothetical protein
VLDLHPGRGGVLADVLDGVDEAGHHVGDLGAEFLVHLAVQRVDDGRVGRLDSTTGREPVGIHAGFGALDQDQVVAMQENGTCGALDHGSDGHG